MKERKLYKNMMDTPYLFLLPMNYFFVIGAPFITILTIVLLAKLWLIFAVIFSFYVCFYVFGIYMSAKYGSYFFSKIMQILGNNFWVVRRQKKFHDLWIKQIEQID